MNSISMDFHGRLGISRGLRVHKACASVAGGDVAVYEGVHAGPGMVAEDVFDSQSTSSVTAEHRVVVLVKDIGAQGRRHIDAAVVEDEIVVG